MVATIDPLRVPTSGKDVFQEGVHRWIKSVGSFIAGQSYDLVLGDVTLQGGTGAHASISARADNDLVTVIEKIGTADLGAGRISLQLSGVRARNGFDPVQDVINIHCVDRLRDFDMFRNGPAGVTLVEGSMTLVLLGLTLAELPELVFVP